MYCNGQVFYLSDVKYKNQEYSQYKVLPSFTFPLETTVLVKLRHCRFLPYIYVGMTLDEFGLSCQSYRLSIVPFIVNIFWNVDKLESNINMKLILVEEMYFISSKSEVTLPKQLLLSLCCQELEQHRAQ